MFTLIIGSFRAGNDYRRRHHLSDPCRVAVSSLEVQRQLMGRDPRDVTIVAVYGYHVMDSATHSQVTMMRRLGAEVRWEE